GSSLNQSAFNIRNAIGAYLAGLPIAFGYGLTSADWVGAGQASCGIIMTIIILFYERKTRNQPETELQPEPVNAKTMDTKPLGNTDLHIPPIVFGGNVFGWTLNEKESFRMLDMLLEAGFTTIDTANSYSHWVGSNSGGESETIIGKWMKKRGTRDKMTIIT